MTQEVTITGSGQSVDIDSEGQSVIINDESQVVIIDIEDETVQVVHEETSFEVTEAQSTVSVVADTEVIVTPPELIEVTIEGLGGAPGPPGEPGPPGQSGTGGDLSYRHVQNIPASLWTINHGLGKFPSIELLDTAGDQMFAEVNHIDSSTATAFFENMELMGSANCN